MNQKSGKKNTKQYRHERLRIITQAVSFAFHNGYIHGWLKGKINTGTNKAFCMPGLNCYSCPGAIGACPIGSLQAVLDSGTMKFSLYVLGFIATVGVLCGRFVCGWRCPFGAIQDLLYRIPLFKKIKNLPGHKYLRWLKYVVLVVFVIVLPMVVTGPGGSGQPWFCEWICPSGTLLGGIPLVIANSNLRAAAGWRFVWKVALLILILIGSVKIYRPFCKYLCPLGALYGGCNKVSLYRLKVQEDKCVGCGACQRACGMDIPVWKTPNSIECIRCGKCMAACPTGALTSTWKELWQKKTVLPTGEESAASNGQGQPADAAITAPSAQAAVTEQAAPMADKKRSKKQSRFTVPGILLLLSGAICGIFALAQLGLYIFQAPAENLLNFIIYDANVLGVLLSALLGILFGIRLLKHRGDGTLSEELKEFARVDLGLTAGVNLIVVPLMLLFTFFIMQGRVSLSYLKNVGLFMLRFLPLWVAMPLITLITLRLFRRAEKAAPPTAAEKRA